MKVPKDTTNYDRDPRSEPIRLGVADGCYVFVRDATKVIYVLPDGAHLHPKVLGGAEAAIYAGDLTVSGNRISDLTNCSGTFQFADKEGLLAVASALDELGFRIDEGAVRLFSYIDSARPEVIR
jgi:hypothetical protein